MPTVTRERIEWQKDYWQNAPIDAKELAEEVVSICDLALLSLSAMEGEPTMATLTTLMDERDAALKRVESLSQSVADAHATILSQLEAAERTGRVLAKQAEQLKRLPDCPPCDMGENTPCTCHSPTMPKEWLDETIVERDAALALVKELRESLDWAMKYGDWAEACDGNPLMKMAYDEARALLLRCQGVK